MWSCSDSMVWMNCEIYLSVSVMFEKVCDVSDCWRCRWQVSLESDNVTVNYSVECVYIRQHSSVLEWVYASNGQSSSQQCWSTKLNSSTNHNQGRSATYHIISLSTNSLPAKGHHLPAHWFSNTSQYIRTTTTTISSTTTTTTTTTVLWLLYRKNLH